MAAAAAGAELLLGQAVGVHDARHPVQRHRRLRHGVHDEAPQPLRLGLGLRRGSRRRGPDAIVDGPGHGECQCARKAHQRQPRRQPAGGHEQGGERQRHPQRHTPSGDPRDRQLGDLPRPHPRLLQAQPDLSYAGLHASIPRSTRPFSGRECSTIAQPGGWGRLTRNRTPLNASVLGGHQCSAVRKVGRDCCGAGLDRGPARHAARTRGSRCDRSGALSLAGGTRPHKISPSGLLLNCDAGGEKRHAVLDSICFLGLDWRYALHRRSFMHKARCCRRTVGSGLAGRPPFAPDLDPADEATLKRWEERAKRRREEAFSQELRRIRQEHALLAGLKQDCLAYAKGDQYDRAITACDEAIKLNPKDADSYINRGLAHDSKGEYERAIAIGLIPKDAVAYNNRGGAYRAMGKYDHAIADLNKAISLNRNIHPGTSNNTTFSRLRLA